MAGTSAGSLFVRLGLDASEYVAGLNKAEVEAQKFQAALQQGALVKGTAIGVALATYGIEAAKMFVGMVQQTLDLQAHLKDLGIQSGLTVAQLDGLRKVGLYSGTSIDEISGATLRLNRALSMTGNSAGGAQRALKALGIDMAEFKKLPADEQLLKVAQAFNKFEDGVGKGTAAMLLFKNSGPGFLKFLKELGERGIQNSQITEESAKRAKEYADNLVTLGVATDELKQRFASDLFPWLVKITEQLIAGRDAFGGFTSALLSLQYELPTKFGGDEGQLKKYRKEVEDTEKALAEVQRKKKSTAFADRAALFIGDPEAGLKADLERSKKYLNYYRTLEANAALRDKTPVAESGTVERLTRKKQLPDLSPEPKAQPGQRTAAAYLKSLEDQIDRAEELTTVLKTQKDIDEKRIFGLTPALEKNLLLKAAEVDLEKRAKVQRDTEKGQVEEMKAWWEKLRLEKEAELRATLASLTASADQNKGIKEETEMLGLNSYEQRLLTLTRLDDTIAMKENMLVRATLKDAEANVIATLREEVRLLKERRVLLGKQADRAYVVDFVKPAEDAAKILRDKNDAIAKDLSESISTGIMEGFRDGQSFADIFLRELKAQFAKTVLTPIIQPIVSAGNDTIKLLMDGILQGLGSLSGMTVSPGDYNYRGSELPGELRGGKSGGGPVSANSLYQVNERRTEGLNVNGEQFLLMGNQGGNVNSNPKTGSSVVVNQVLHVGQGVSRSEVAAAMRIAKDSAKAEIMRSMKQNGAYALG